MYKIMTRHGIWVPEHIFQAILNGENRVIHIESDRNIYEEDGIDLFLKYSHKTESPRIIMARVEEIEEFYDECEGEILALTLNIVKVLDADDICTANEFEDDI